MAAREQGDTAAMEAALEALLPYAATEPGLWRRALVVAGRDEEAAGVLISRLQDPLLRTDALVDLQEGVPGAMTPRESDWQRHGRALRERPEVQRLIDALGRVHHHPLHL